MKVTTFQKAVLLLLCTALLLSTTLTVSAEQQSTPVSATVIAQNSPTFTLTIPATLETESVTRTSESTPYSIPFEITMSDLSALNGKTVFLHLYSGDDGFNLRNENTLLPFTVYGPLDPVTPLKNGDLFASFTEAKTETGRIQIDQKDITSSGSYSGSILFSVTIE
ncbi:MAG: hypothetical protein IJX80_07355 [Clostridia bacterium]|nr:hypothetical protein [Clostridia bacterium]